MELSSDAIDRNGYFDPRYTCDMDNSSPELRWDGIPDGVKGFAVIAEDPDAHSGLFTHWQIYNIPAAIKHLPAGIPVQETLPNGIRQGVNSFNKLGYAGPCPPLGDRPHRYIFRLYALSELSEMKSRVTREELLRTITPFVISTVEMTGRYQRLAQKAG